MTSFDVEIIAVLAAACKTSSSWQAVVSLKRLTAFDFSELIIVNCLHFLHAARSY